MSGHSTVRSKDGTSIVYDSAGDGPVLILVGGAFSYRRYKSWVQLAELLAPRFRVISYDRRGRGDSGDAPEHAVEREIEDLDALVQAAGGSAHVFGMSSGGVLALRAAAAGVPIRRAVVYQPPFSVDASGHLPPADFGERLDELVASGRRARRSGTSCGEGMGAPRVLVGVLRVARPIWRSLEAVAHTLPYDYAVMDGYRPREAARPRAVGLDRDADARRRRRQEPGLAAQGVRRARRAHAERRTAHPQRAEPQPLDEDARAGAGGLPA